MKSSVCLNMIVKNEASVIKRCLASVKNLIDYWVIVDTGSTDNTQKIIRNFLKQIPGQLYERPWVDFSFNRNEALQLAKTKGDYLLFIDADEYLEFINETAFPLLKDDFYMSVYLHGAFQSVRTLLVNSRFNWKWNGVIHEAVECPEAKKIGLLKNVINHATQEGKRSENLDHKFRRDIKLLESVLETEPQNTRIRFHLAQHYEAIGDFNSALKHYEIRASGDGMKAEIFYSLYRIGIIQKEFGMPSQMFINALLRAFDYRPWRAEPLYSLAEYFIEIKAYFLGFVITRFALNAKLFDEHYLTFYKIYDYGLFGQFAECSFRVGRYQDACRGLESLLAVKTLPSDVRLASEKNLASIKRSLLDHP